MWPVSRRLLTPQCFLNRAPGRNAKNSTSPWMGSPLKCSPCSGEAEDARAGASLLDTDSPAFFFGEPLPGDVVDFDADAERVRVDKLRSVLPSSASTRMEATIGAISATKAHVRGARLQFASFLRPMTY